MSDYNGSGERKFKWN